MKIHVMHLTLASDIPILHIRPWPDPVIDKVGHDPRSTYVERFWLSVLGPSTTWLLRRIATSLEQSPAGFDLPLVDTARALGIGGDGKGSPFIRALNRCCQFEVARPEDDGVLAVRRRLPPLNRRQLVRLPEGLQAEHDAWLTGALREPEIDKLRRRSRRLALSLLELGEDLEATERQLQRWRFHPAICHESVQWAWREHLAASATVVEPAAAADLAS
jgi:hypothetical protein